MLRHRALRRPQPRFRQHLRSAFSTLPSATGRTVEPVDGGDPFPTWSYDPPEGFRFEVVHQSSKSSARVGRLHTPHGIVHTPAFVPVATNGALKYVDQRTSDETGCQLTFANTYHLLLQPGPEIIKEAGGLHKFMRRGVSTDRNSDGEAALPTAGALITDSGGFQVFSMMARTLNLPEEVSLKGAGSKSKSYTNADESLVLKVSEKGVLFRSYRDGSKILLTPETTVQTQHDIGADIIIPLDELLAYSADEKAIRESLARTHRWETRSLREHLSSGAKAKTQAMFAVLHGGMDPKLRAESIDYLTSLPFDGWAVGGSFGKDRNDLATLLAMIGPHMEAVQRAQGLAKPIHLLGIADLRSISLATPYGLDTFDSSFPTKVARHGSVIVSSPNGELESFDYLKIKRGVFARDYSVILEGCPCQACSRGYSKAYLYHLIKAKEPLAAMLLSEHNLAQMNRYMDLTRQAILRGEI